MKMKKATSFKSSRIAIFLHSWLEMRSASFFISKSFGTSCVRKMQEVVDILFLQRRFALASLIVNDLRSGDRALRHPLSARAETRTGGQTWLNDQRSVRPLRRLHVRAVRPRSEAARQRAAPTTTASRYAGRSSCMMAFPQILP